MKTLRPSLTNSIGRSYIRSLVRPTPLWVQLFVTRRCNFNCQYCGAVDNKSEDPSLEELEGTIRKIRSLGCRSIGLMGGEPTLRKDIVELVEFCSRNGIYTELPTNGTLLLHASRTMEGKTLLDQLVYAGLGLVNLSVDTVTSDSEASEKRLPKMTKVLEALLAAKKQSGLRIVLNCVITKLNIGEVPTLLEFCHEHGVSMAAIFAQDPYQFIKDKASSKSILFSHSDKAVVGEMADFLIDKKKSGYKLLDPIAYYKSIKAWLAGELEWDCGAGRTSLNVDIDGRISICGYLPFLDLTLWELEGNFHEKLRSVRDGYLPQCSRQCIPTCMFSTAYYLKHPLEAIAKAGV